MYPGATTDPLLKNGRRGSKQQTTSGTAKGSKTGRFAIETEKNGVQPKLNFAVRQRGRSKFCKTDPFFLQPN